MLLRSARRAGRTTGGRRLLLQPPADVGTALVLRQGHHAGALVGGHLVQQCLHLRRDAPWRFRSAVTRGGGGC